MRTTLSNILSDRYNYEYSMFRHTWLTKQREVYIWLLNDFTFFGANLINILFCLECSVDYSPLPPFLLHVNHINVWQALLLSLVPVTLWPPATTIILIIEVVDLLSTTETWLSAKQNWDIHFGITGNTVEPVLKDHPIGHKNVVCQDRWSLVTGSIILEM